MAKMEKKREVLQGPITPQYLDERTAEGWRMVAVEWERAAIGKPQPFGEMETELPYGLQVAADCQHLEENPVEKEALVLMLELIVQDLPFSKIASELNDRGYRTRSGGKWSPVAVFDLLPRMIEVGPRIFGSEEWAEQRQRLFKIFA